MGPTEDPVLCSLGELEARDNLPRVPHAAVEAFQYSTPCIITGATRSWKVPVAEGPGEGTGWSPEGLVARHGAQDFEVSLPGNGAARWTMARYLDYCRGWEEGLERGCEDGGGTGAALEGGRETDIADPDGTTQQGKAERGGGGGGPAYLWETLVPSRPQDKEVMRSYSVPAFFGEEHDLFSAAPEGALGVYRWMLVGPRGSGSNIHRDPHSTSAWNALTHGHKRWVVIHPDAPEGLVKRGDLSAMPAAAGEERGGEAGGGAGYGGGYGGGAQELGSAREWFAQVYPAVMGPSWPAAYTAFEALQKPGEIIYVPAGWWHVVLNMDTTSCVTHNFAHPANIGRVAQDVFRGTAFGGASACGAADAWLSKVHCGTETPTVHPLLEWKRPVCRECEKTETLGATDPWGDRLMYELLSLGDAEEAYALDTRDVEELPCVTIRLAGRRGKFFLWEHVEELAEEVHGCAVRGVEVARRARAISHGAASRCEGGGDGAGGGAPEWAPVHSVRDRGLSALS